MGSFQEAVIVPLSLWKECKFDSDTDNTIVSKILEDETIPSDVKLKLVAQEDKYQEPSKSRGPPTPPPSPPSVPKTQPIKASISEIVSEIKQQFQPNVRSILEKINLFPDQIFWDDKLRITIDGKLFPNSNIIKILNFLMKSPSSIVTNNKDIPEGAWETREKLLQIGTPPSWILNNPIRKSNREKKKKKPLKGSGRTNWITY